MIKFSPFFSIVLLSVLLIQLSVGHVINENVNSSIVNGSPIVQFVKSTGELNHTYSVLDANSLNDRINQLDSELDGELNDNKNENSTNGTADAELNAEDASRNETAKLLRQLEGKLNPIILIPGLEGSRLEATLNRSSTGHYYCKKKQKESFTIWINLEEFVIPAVNCFVDNLKLNYNNETRRTSSPDGVKITAPGFGDTDSIGKRSDLL